MSAPGRNPWEAAARLRKALALLAVMPADAPAAFRELVAARAGVRPPSAETWGEVVAARRRGAERGAA